MQDNTSRDVCRAAIEMALSADRDQEHAQKERLERQGIHAAAVDFGGDFIASVQKIIERAIVAGKREGLIGDHHNEEGAMAGAAREAVTQITAKATGLNVGGKIGLARRGEHVAVALFAGIGLLHLNENAIGLGHRAV